MPLHNLNNKVVGLYFCPCIYYQQFTEELTDVYQELSNNMEDFEIVLIYAHGWFEHQFGRTDEHSFMEAFQTMPWLALPFTDTDCSKKLQRIFQYPQELLGRKPDARLVIVGPLGKFIEPLGANILSTYGVPAYPFTTSNTVNLELEKLKKVKLEMLWDQNSVLTKINGFQVSFFPHISVSCPLPLKVVHVYVTLLRVKQKKKVVQTLLKIDAMGEVYINILYILYNLC